MRKYGYLLAVIVVIVVMLGSVACTVDLPSQDAYSLMIDAGLPTTLTVGDEVDFTKYFIVHKGNEKVEITDEMLDLSEVDLTKEGTFTVTFTYQTAGFTKKLTFTVVAKPEGEATVCVSSDAVLTVTVGDEIDFKSIFVVTDKDGNSVVVTDDMLDLSEVDLTKAGTFDVICTYQGVSAKATFTVKSKDNPDELTLDEILAKYEDPSKWNYEIVSTVTYADSTGESDDITYVDLFSYCGTVIKYEHLNEDDDTDSHLYIDYIVVDDANEIYVYYYDLGDETYQKYDFSQNPEVRLTFPELFLDMLSGEDFIVEGDHYVAKDPKAVGNSVYAEYDGCTYTKVELYVENNEVSRIVFYSDEEINGVVYNCLATFEISNHGKISYSVDDLTVVYGDVENPDELKSIFEYYTSLDSEWNFALDCTVSYDGTQVGSFGVSYAGDSIKSVYSSDGEIYIDYLAIVDGDLVYYSDNGDGTHTAIASDNLFFEYLYLGMYPCYLTEIGSCMFEAVGDHYQAVYPQVTGEALYGAADNCVYTSVELYVQNGKISSIVFYSDEEDEQGEYSAVTRFELSGYGEQTIDLSGLVIVDDGGDDPDPADNPKELTDALGNYADYDSWNFRVELEGIENGSTVYEDTYWYLGRNTKNQYLDEEGYIYTDYLGYNVSENAYYFYYDNGDGTYEKYHQDSDEYYYYVSYMTLVDPNVLNYVQFELDDGKYVAVDPVTAGEYFFGELSSDTYTGFTLTLANGVISSVNIYLQSGYVLRYTFLNYNEVSFDLPEKDSDPSIDGSKSTFINASLGVNKGEQEYELTFGKSYGYDAERGVQFTQAGGEVIIASKNAFSNVTSIQLECFTNAPSGMIIVVKVGGVALTIDGNSEVQVDKSSDIQTLTFVSATALNGKIEITMTPCQSSKSMYLKSVTIDADAGGDNPVEPDDEATVRVAPDAVLVVSIGDEIDFKSIFEIIDKDGNSVTVTDDMLDLSEVDLTKAGTFDVKCTYEGVSATATFTVESKDSDVVIEDDVTSTFIGNVAVGEGELEYDASMNPQSFIDNRGLQFYQSNGAVIITSVKTVSGLTTVTVVCQTNADSGMTVSVKVGGVSLVSSGRTSVLVEKTGYNSGIGLVEMSTVTFVSGVALRGKVEITLTPCQNSKSMYLYSITLGSGKSVDPVDPVDPDEMEDQVYDPDSFDDSRLQDKMMEKHEAIGIPSTGDLRVLVIPVQIGNYAISSATLEKINKAFNGTSADVGWESVSSFYNKSSYGKLNLTFDISPIYKAQKTQREYERAQYGSELILIEALTYLDSLADFDFSQYDSNGDGCIDAVYLLYSCPVDSTSGDSFYWAYVTTSADETKFDGLWSYYYMFAGIDFMDENVDAYGIAINTETYIHETGHLFGLDDYYDYDESVGSNEGLGGADMMDYNIGDHGVYSKIMLGWMDATIVTSTTTITINASSQKGDCILIPLSFDNSYFSEYLLIDLYSATGLNEFESKMSSSYLYDGASSGVRIYHVASEYNSLTDDDNYFYLTTNDNSYSDNALIKLVEADGDSRFSSSRGLASESDLWQAGDVFSTVFSSYTRYDGKKINFDIEIVSVSSSQATITITFNA